MFDDFPFDFPIVKPRPQTLKLQPPAGPKPNQAPQSLKTQ